MAVNGLSPLCTFILKGQRVHRAAAILTGEEKLLGQRQQHV